jgi:hypothetical protein
MSATFNEQLQLFERRLKRERHARKQAESLLEKKVLSYLKLINNYKRLPLTLKIRFSNERQN